jgi:hypothetical protein
MNSVLGPAISARMSSTDDLFVARKLQLGRGRGAPVVVDHVGRLAERGKKSGGGPPGWTSARAGVVSIIAAMP